MPTSEVIDARRIDTYCRDMGTMTLGKVIRGRFMAVIPDDIDREALKILVESGFRWDTHADGFRRGVSTIDYAFLRTQNLVSGASVSARDRTGQLLRLRILIQSLD